MRFFESCQNEKEVKEVYRKLAKCFHPDKGGNAELMVELEKQYADFKKGNISYSGSFGYGSRPTFGNVSFDHPLRQEIIALKDKIRELEDRNVCSWNSYNESKSVLEKRCEREYFRGRKEVCDEMFQSLENLEEENKKLKKELSKTFWHKFKEWMCEE